MNILLKANQNSRETKQHYLDALKSPAGREHSIISFLANDQFAPASTRNDAKGFIYSSIGQDILNAALVAQGANSITSSSFGVQI